jgi:chromatin segregation and condensation protein Rec8/ScpA/Scc1 (kleisin family)
LAVLELIRIRQIEVNQESPFGEITLNLVEGNKLGS